MELRQSLEGDDLADIRAKTEALTEASHKLAEAMYAEAQQQAQASARRQRRLAAPTTRSSRTPSTRTSTSESSRADSRAWHGRDRGEEQQPVEDDRLLRLAADFDNYKKRAAREREEYVALANARLLTELLPGHRRPRARARRGRAARGGAARGRRPPRPPLARGAARAARRRRSIETDGKFDPHVHEALLSQPSEEAESGSVINVVQKGYKLGDRVVRPARVIVAE